jgi:VIT1/CCC1 family predicted Fe2+/Mn2+ transporter
MSSAVPFVVGAIISKVASLPPRGDRVSVTVAAVLAAPAVAGMSSARLGGAPLRNAVVRVLVGGALGLLVSYAIGRASGTAVGQRGRSQSGPRLGPEHVSRELC